MAELTDPANFIERFEGIVQFIRLESNNICFGLAPEPDVEVEQCLELSDKGLGKILRFNMSSPEGQPESEIDLCIGAERARKILDAIGDHFAERTSGFATDIGTWNLTIINTDGREFHFNGSLIEDAGLSDLIRSELGMKNLFLFDGNPDRIEGFDLAYRKSIKDTTKPGEDNGYWYYLERLTIDRAKGLFEFTQGVGGRNSATYIFRDAQDVASLLNQFDLLPEDFESDEPEDLMENELIRQEYKLTIHYRHTPTFEISGGYDR